MTFSATERIDAINIGLMMLACVLAILVPLELFLFSYAILGPLHYLTEISWLHDRNYFAKGKFDALMLLIVGLLITVSYYSLVGIVSLEFPANFLLWLAYIGLLSAAVFTFVKSVFLRIGLIVLIVVSSQLSEHFALWLGVFLPTLVHVYVFTALFMLYGALKSKSRLGILAVILLLLCPFFLYYAFPNFKPFGFSEVGQKMYFGDKGRGFFGLHVATLSEYFGLKPTVGVDGLKYWMNEVFHSQTGILVMRFIAFAYTYHYLNWFSKTSIIQWHKVPKKRFIAVIAIWLVSLCIYLYDYTLGLIWLFFLSYLHVLLEFPLNYTSVVGIIKFFHQRFFRATAKPAKT